MTRLSTQNLRSRNRRRILPTLFWCEPFSVGINELSGRHGFLRFSACPNAKSAAPAIAGCERGTNQTSLCDSGDVHFSFGSSTHSTAGIAPTPSLRYRGRALRLRKFSCPLLFKKKWEKVLFGGDCGDSRWRCCLFICLTLVLSISYTLRAQHLTITHLNVGQGDATVIQVQNGRTILIDAGLPGKGIDVVVPWLRKNGITRLDAIVASHYHADHIGGISEVIDALSPDSVLLVIDRGSQLPLPRNRTFAAYSKSVGRVRHRKHATPGFVLQLGDHISLSCVAANGTVDRRGIVAWDRRNENDLSIAWVLSASLPVGDRQYVFRYFTGGDCGGYHGTHTDLETPISTVVGMVDVLRVNHHGSRNSTNEVFLRALRPRVAVISVGDGNRYRHPASETLERLQSTASIQAIYQTERGATPPQAVVKVVGHATVAVHDSFFIVHQDTFQLRGQDPSSSSETQSERVLKSVETESFASDRLMKFELTRPAILAIAIHNLLGQPLVSLPAKRYDAGSHTVSLNHLDLPPGIYFVSVSTCSERIVKRISIAK
jgi:beta-lactamase superfamily II metal-dependent hydrolase